MGLLKKTLLGCTTLLALSAWSSEAEDQNCETEFRSDSAAVFNCSGVKLIKIKGSALQRAQTLGELHRQHILSSEVLDEFATKAQRTVSSNVIIQKLIGLYIDHWIHQRTKPKLASQFEELKVFADAAHYSEKKLKRALFVPDLGTYAEGQALGCTSGIYRAPDSFMGVVRNLDFAGVGSFDTHPAILVYLPEEAGEKAYLSLGAEGVPWAGITGMNEAGLYFAVHQNFTSDTNSKTAQPLLFVGDGLLRKSGNLEEALVYLQKNRPLGLWTFVLVDFKNRAAATVEVSARRWNVRRMTGDILGQANHLLGTPDAKKLETGTVSRQLNSEFRLKKAEEILRQLAAQPAVGDRLREMLKVLAYQDSSDGSYSAFRDIQRADTIQSVGVESEGEGRTKLWMGIDGAPTSTGRFATFQSTSLWNRDLLEDVRFQVVQSNTDPGRRESQTRYARVYYFAEEKKDISSAIKLLDHENSPSGLLMRSYLLWKAKKAAKALADLERNLQERMQEIQQDPRLEESYWVFKAKLLSETVGGEESRVWAQHCLDGREDFYNADRRVYLETMLSTEMRGQGRDREEVFLSPPDLRWNYAFGDFK
jgi:hypothetical protein